MDKKYDVLCTGMALVDSIIKGFNPEPVSASGFTAVSDTLSVGGEAVNEAMAAAKLGLKTGILCSLGNDAAGDMIEKALTDNGVITDAILRESPATPVTTMFVNGDGTRKSITNSSHRYNYRPGAYADTLASARCVTLGSLFRAPYDDPGEIAAVLRAAHDGGAIVFADTKLPNFRRLSLDDLAELLPMIDYIFPNEDEARYFSGRTGSEDMADEFLGRGVRNVIVKLGAKGCFFKNCAERITLPAYEIEAADATGAGDNFMAGFIYALLNGFSHRDSLKFANACGAICTGAVGASAGLRSSAQVFDFIKNH